MFNGREQPSKNVVVNHRPLTIRTWLAFRPCISLAFEELATTHYQLTLNNMTMR